MEGGGSVESYASNSQPQLHSFHTIAQPILSLALNLYIQELLPNHHHLPFAVADLGSSHGPNALRYFSFISSHLRNSSTSSSFELLYYFSDLPSNDFNSLFADYVHLLNATFSPSQESSACAIDSAADHDHSRTAVGCGGDGADFKLFAAGVPGSFYNRLFPSRSLQFVVCALSLHWLSQIPREVLDPSSDAWNGGYVWLHPSRRGAMAALARQSQRDLETFLTFRAEEMSSGGVLFIFGPSRRREEEPSRFLEGLWRGHFQTTWDELVSEGFITAHERDTFNVPNYALYPDKLRRSLATFSNEFELLHLVVHDDCSVLPDDELERLCQDSQLFGDFWANFVGSMTKPMLEKHLGEMRAREFLDRLRQVAMESKDGASPRALLRADLFVAIVRRL